MGKRDRHIRLPLEIDKRLIDLSNIRGINITDTVIELIKGAFESKQDNDYKILDDLCPFRAFLYSNNLKKEGFYCAEKAPKHTKLGDGTIHDVEKLCKSCKIKKSTIEENKQMREQLNKGTVISIPSCSKGGKVNEAMDKIWCPEIGRTRPIKEKKKKTDYIPCREAGNNKSNCKWLKWTQTVIKGELPRADNK